MDVVLGTLANATLNQGSEILGLVTLSGTVKLEYTYELAPVVTPEPTSVMLFGTGAAAFIARRRRRHPLLSR